MKAHERYKLSIFQIYSVSLFFNFTVLVIKKGGRGSTMLPRYQDMLKGLLLVS